MKNSKLKLFIENFIVYGFGGIISKVIPLIMVPVLTRIMPNSMYYGISDLVNTIVSFGSALAIMGMYDAMYRMFFENDENSYKREICSTTLAFVCCSSAIVSVLLLIFNKAFSSIVFGDSQYGWLVCIAAFTTLIGSTNGIVSAPTRMQNKRKVFLIVNTASPIISYSISIPLLLTGHYLIALPLAALISAILQEVFFYILNREWFDFRHIETKYIKPLLIIAVPIVPVFLIYWVFNSCDRIMITRLMDASATGIYSVGAKLGHVSQLIYTAFAGGWQFFAFSTMKEDNQVESNTKVFEYLALISFVASMFVFSLSNPVYSILFTEEYHEGYMVAPYLFLSPLLLMLFQVAGNQFLVIKKTWYSLFTLTFGAIVNVILNLWMIPILGIEGAAIATLAGYIVSVILCITVLSRMKLHIISGRFVFMAVLMLGFIIVWRFCLYDKPLISLGVSVVVSVLMGLGYGKEISAMIAGIK